MDNTVCIFSLRIGSLPVPKSNMQIAEIAEIDNPNAKSMTAHLA
jgi:hypothetical protein